MQHWTRFWASCVQPNILILMAYNASLILPKDSFWVLQFLPGSTYQISVKYRVFSVWGELQYRHRMPASSTRRWKGNPVSGNIIGHSVTGGYKYRDLVLQAGVGCKADDLALYKSYSCEIKGRGIRMQSLRTLARRLWLKMSVLLMMMVIIMQGCA
jgi:hypothetical protein